MTFRAGSGIVALQAVHRLQPGLGVSFGACIREGWVKLDVQIGDLKWATIQFVAYLQLGSTITAIPVLWLVFARIYNEQYAKDLPVKGSKQMTAEAT